MATDYQCPRCQWADLVPKEILSRPVVGKPWRQRKTGCVCQCPNCLVILLVTANGVVVPKAIVDQVRAAQPAANTRHPDVEQNPERIIGELFGDENLPTWRGQ